MLLHLVAERHGCRNLTRPAGRSRHFSDIATGGLTRKHSPAPTRMRNRLDTLSRDQYLFLRPKSDTLLSVTDRSGSEQANRSRTGHPRLVDPQDNRS